jgi:LPXTG-motif cell wall-anchored protein
LGTAFLAGMTTSADAHSVLLVTAPAEGARVHTAPSNVVLTFNEMPRQRFSTVHVFGPDGARRDSGSVRVVNDTVNQELGGSRPPGRYTVDWRVISADGHPVSGQFAFTAVAAGGALAAIKAPASEPASAASSGGSNSSTTVLIILIVVVVLALAAGGFFLKRRRDRPVGAGNGPRVRSRSPTHQDNEDDA